MEIEKGKVVFVGGLSWDVQDADLEHIFSKCGQVLDAEVKYYGDQPRGFGYVTFADVRGAQTAIKELNETEIKGRRISVRSYQHPSSSKLAPSPTPTSTPTQTQHTKEQISESLIPLTGMSYSDTPMAPRKDPYSQLQEAMTLIAELSAENKALKVEITTLSMRVSNLETVQKLPSVDDTIKTRVEQLETYKQAVLDQLQSSKQHADQQIEQDNLLRSQLESLREMHRKLKDTMQDKLDKQQRALRIRVGGLPNAIPKQLSQVMPMIHGWDTVCGSMRIPHIHQAILTFSTKHDRDVFLGQSYKLKGTDLWLAPDLTQKQLQTKKSELEKVRTARSQGKWAVYRDGRAVIQEFKNKMRARKERDESKVMEQAGS